MEDEFILDMSKTYIYEGNEYIATGRYAEKVELDDEEPVRRRRSKRHSVKKDNLRNMQIQITPAPKRGKSPSSNVGVTREEKWVYANELFMVHDMLDDEDTE
jgi:hypothetical protein